MNRLQIYALSLIMFYYFSKIFKRNKQIVKKKVKKLTFKSNLVKVKFNAFKIN